MQGVVRVLERRPMQTGQVMTVVGSYFAIEVLIREVLVDKVKAALKDFLDLWHQA
jgi:hypothetical protein